MSETNLDLASLVDDETSVPAAAAAPVTPPVDPNDADDDLASFEL